LTWERGRSTVETRIAGGELELVTPSPQLAELLMGDAARHLASARLIAASDPTGAYQLAYDAARKACSALLAAQGLRATTRGGHVAVQDVVRAQFNGDGGVPAFRAFPRLRRTRAAREYPDVDTPTTTAEDVADAIDAASAMETAARQILDTGRLDRFVPHG
jgi:hypothetical protein